MAACQLCDSTTGAIALVVLQHVHTFRPTGTPIGSRVFIAYSYFSSSADTRHFCILAELHVFLVKISTHIWVIKFLRDAIPWLLPRLQIVQCSTSTTALTQRSRLWVLQRKYYSRLQFLLYLFLMRRGSPAEEYKSKNICPTWNYHSCSEHHIPSNSVVSCINAGLLLYLSSS